MKASSVDADSREQLIKDHLTNRINQLTLNLQLAESKAINFHAEVRALHKRLAIAEEAKEKSIEELKQATTVQAQLKDDLATTTRSYEGQLRMMSEHLASMNEKLTTQKDEIDELKMQQAMSKVSIYLKFIFIVESWNLVQAFLMNKKTRFPHQPAQSQP
ncbi:protein phosphatase 1 regulatory subunit 21-like, partial [Octopus sinensis]|uniref:Protein phosphatase 1 regulatory subunit 21-like n=1 Tax=Octopus sinensis TaxID=2607531 RepID=A0A6P7TP28_9MOLL